LILIVISLAIFALISIFGRKLKLPFGQGLPRLEKHLSYSKAAFTRNTLALIIFISIVLVPSLFVALPAFQAIVTEEVVTAAFTGSGIWSDYWQSLLISYALGAIVTILGILSGLPMAILIARKTFGKLPSAILNVLVNIPLIVPSIALGISLRFFWEGFTGIPEFLLLVFAHLSITYPYFVRSMSAAMERINVDMEEASKTLGAKPFTVFKSIVCRLQNILYFQGQFLFLQEV
jgi:thiamine transport system permease protein